MTKKQKLKKVTLTFTVNDNKRDLGIVTETFKFKNKKHLELLIRKFEKGIIKDWNDITHTGKIWISQIEPITINGKEFEY